MRGSLSSATICGALSRSKLFDSTKKDFSVVENLVGIIHAVSSINKTNSTNLYPPTKGYLRETCKSQNINPIYLNLKFTFGIIQIITYACLVCFSA